MRLRFPAVRVYSALPLDPGRGLNGRLRRRACSRKTGYRLSDRTCSDRLARQDRRVRRPVSPPSEHSSLSRRARGAWRRGERGNEGKGSHAALRTRLPCAPGRKRAAGRGIDRAPERCRRRSRRKGGQDRILGSEIPLLSTAQEPQGAFHVDESRCAIAGDQRDRAVGAPQRGRAALPHHPRRRARGRPVGDDAPGGARPRPRRTPWRPRGPKRPRGPG